MTRPRTGAQGFDVVDQRRSDGVEVDVTNQLQEVGLLFDHDGLEAVLEEVAGAVVTSVGAERIAGKEPAHQSLQRDFYQRAVREALGLEADPRFDIWFLDTGRISIDADEMSDFGSSGSEE